MTSNTNNAAFHPALSNTRECACGCGRQTKSVWFPGDDARAKALLRSVARGEADFAALPGQLPDLGPALAVKWGLAVPNEDGVGLAWSAEAKAPAKPSKDEAPALRHLRRAREALPEGDATRDAIDELIKAMA